MWRDPQRCVAWSVAAFHAYATPVTGLPHTTLLHVTSTTRLRVLTNRELSIPLRCDCCGVELCGVELGRAAASADR